MDNTLQDVMTTEESANYLRIKKNTLEVWRLKGIGPVYIKLGRRVLYRKESLEKFMLDCERRSTSGK
jgi:predicted site-specific integrase-resolvase